jgi:hypothetical protein
MLCRIVATIKRRAVAGRDCMVGRNRDSEQVTAAHAHEYG